MTSDIKAAMASVAACIRHYSPRHGRHTNRRLAAPSGPLTPPRISPSCSRCLYLRLSRGTIVG